MSSQVSVRELGAWGLDEYEYRSGLGLSAVAAGNIQQRLPYVQQDPVRADAVWETLLASHRKREDLLLEMNGLDWSLGIVDLRCLLAFQRRISFDPRAPQTLTPCEEDQHSLLACCFPPTPSAHYDCTLKNAQTLMVQSQNPNLQVRLSSTAECPVVVSNGSPFLEVAKFRGRWFLRDGYHRAYALLQQGISSVPAVIVQARSLVELGATKPWFFPESILFSDRPPLVTDFLHNALTLRYTRPALTRTIRVTIESSLTSQSDSGEYP